MLALTRRVGEEVVIGDPRNPLGVVRVVSVNGDKIRLGFEFGPEIEINRRELAEQKLRDQDAADQPTKPARQPEPAPGNRRDNGQR
ncbi:MAG: carbon storage regulator [Phycisphaeraceae bacterium]